MSQMKQNIILQNILANAVESCVRCPDNRFIQFTVRPTDYHEVIIECTNSCMGVNPDFQTYKENKEEHGIGLKSVQRVVKANGGKVLCEYEGKKFKTTVLLMGDKKC